LPDHYTTLLLERLRERDRALLDFLDLFNHRAISHFYRAWEKYRLPFAMERSRLEQSDDPGTQCVFSFIGYGTGSLRGRLEVEDQVLLYYAGHFSSQRRSAASLEALLRDHFQIPLQVRQFSGQWLHLDHETRSCLAGPTRPQGQNAQLGVSVIAGERVWDVQSKFRLYIGPLTYSRFRQYTPCGDKLTQLVQLTRAFVGPEYDFDIQLALQGEQTPDVCLGATGATQPRLGWNTWLRSQPTGDIVTDAVFKTSNLGSAADPITTIF
jgi:type VI secretion system protein ImpH